MGEGTRTWEQAKFDELSKGTSTGVALRSVGGLELAPAFKALATTPSTYIWAIAADNAGNLYAAAGSPARVYRITPDGKSTSIFEPQELQVQALLVDKNGALYAATNPDGKVYKLERKATEAGKDKKGPEASWSSSVYFDPGTKYIWDMVQDAAGNLFVATGDHGEIFRVTPKGEHTQFFKSDEAHIRVVAFDHKGNLIAGSDGSGLVYRIAPGGEAFVLYSAPKKEITALAIDDADNIYAAGVGEKRASGPTFTPLLPASPAQGNPNPTAGQQPSIVIGAASPLPSPAAGPFPLPGMGASGGSEIYRIAPDGSPNRIWGSREEIVYALAFDSGRLLAGTGNRGHIFVISGEDRFTDLVQASAGQTTAFAKAPGGGLYVSTSNLGKVFLLGVVPQADGSYESDVFDARIFSRWGRLEYRGVGNIELFARSGNVDNPDRNWSPWKKVDLAKDGLIPAPAARFIQWKAVLHAGAPEPRLDTVVVNYLSKNVAPDFDDVSVQLGVRYQALPKIAGGDAGAASGGPRFDAPPPSVRDADSVGIKWAVHDDNDDTMTYSVYYRGDGEGRWLLLKDNLSDKFYSFDASLLPDGAYTVKIVASDAPSHSPGQALSAERESSRFEVDTTAPVIQDLAAAVEGGQIHASFRAVDGFSNIKRAEYSLDAGEWQFIEPVDQLSDSKSESYDIRIAVPAGDKKISAGSTDHVLVVRVYDRYDNMNAAKTVIRGK